MPQVCARQLFSTTSVYLVVGKHHLRLDDARPTPRPRLPVRRRERLGAGRRRQPGADLLGGQPAPVGAAAGDRADPVPAGRPGHRAHRGGAGARRPDRRGDEPVGPARPGGRRPARRALGAAVDRLLRLRRRGLDALARQAADRGVPRPGARAGAQRGRAADAARWTSTWSSTRRTPRCRAATPAPSSPRTSSWPSSRAATPWPRPGRSPWPTCGARPG